jgi:hypothetical protein
LTFSRSLAMWIGAPINPNIPHSRRDNLASERLTGAENMVRMLGRLRASSGDGRKVSI